MNKPVKANLIKYDGFKKISLSKNMFDKANIINQIESNKSAVLLCANKCLEPLREFFNVELTQANFIREQHIQYDEHEVWVTLHHNDTNIAFARIDRCTLEQLVYQEFGGVADTLYSPLRHPSVTELSLLNKFFLFLFESLPGFSNIISICKIKFVNQNNLDKISAGWEILLPEAYHSKPVFFGVTDAYMNALLLETSHPNTVLDYELLSSLFELKLQQVPIKMSLDVGQQNLPAGMLSELEKDDIIPINLHQTNILKIGVIPLFQASIHASNNTLVAKIIQPFED